MTGMTAPSMISVKMVYVWEKILARITAAIATALNIALGVTFDPRLVRNGLAYFRPATGQTFST